MGGIGGGSFKTNKLSIRGKMNNSAYNKNAASMYGNNKFGFKMAPKTSSSNIKVNTEIKGNESK